MLEIIVQFEGIDYGRIRFRRVKSPEREELRVRAPEPRVVYVREKRAVIPDAIVAWQVVVDRGTIVTMAWPGTGVVGGTP